MCDKIPSLFVLNSFQELFAGTMPSYLKKFCYNLPILFPKINKNCIDFYALIRSRRNNVFNYIQNFITFDISIMIRKVLAFSIISVINCSF